MLSFTSINPFLMISKDTKINCLFISKYTSWLVFIMGLIYAVITLSGFLSLDSPDEPIGHPYFCIMEVLILIISPVMAISMAAIHYCNESDTRIYSFIAVCLMFIMAAITSCVHTLILTVGDSQQFRELPEYNLLFSFRWPSIAYALDVLAWDWFYGLSIIFGAIQFRQQGLEKTIKVIMMISGILSLIGLGGLPTGNMQIRNIGIIGYAIFGPVAFLLISIRFNQKVKLMTNLAPDYRLRHD